MALFYPWSEERGKSKFKKTTFIFYFFFSYILLNRDVFHYSDIQAMLTSLVLTEKKHKNAKHCWLNLNIPALPIIDQFVSPKDLFLGIKMEHLKILLKSSNHHLSLQQVVCCWRVLPQCWCCWLIRVVVVEGWEQKWGLPYWMIFPFMINFSIALNAI